MPVLKYAEKKAVSCQAICAPAIWASRPAGCWRTWGSLYSCLEGRRSRKLEAGARRGIKKSTTLQSHLTVLLVAMEVDRSTFLPTNRRSPRRCQPPIAPSPVSNFFAKTSSLCFKAVACIRAVQVSNGLRPNAKTKAFFRLTKASLG